MEININIEIANLNKIVNKKEISPFKQYHTPNYYFQKLDVKVKYLLYILELTYYHPKIEIYLKQLLENYNIAELNNLDGNKFTILHYMSRRANNISLNSFEMIINFGINVNSSTIRGKNCLLDVCPVPFEHTINVHNFVCQVSR